MIKIGIEIETSSKTTTDTFKVIKRLGWELKGDGSIRVKTPTYSQNEFITPPYDIDLNNIDKAINQICKDYKKVLDSLQGIEINESMGIHIHFSGFKKHAVYYSQDFFNMVKTRYLAFCKTEIEKNRINNHYCLFTYEKNQRDRYRAINIKPAYERHKTIELRFFPSTKSLTDLKRYLTFALTIIKETETTEIKTDCFNYTINNKDETNHEFKTMV
jgi:hypothetical protein